MTIPDGLTDTCRHDQAPLVRIGKRVRAGRPVYVLLCTECGFMVSTDELRRLRAAGVLAKQLHTRSLPREVGL